MKNFNVSSKDFEKFLSKLNSVINKKCALPILSTAILSVDTEESKISGRASDLELQIEASCDIALPSESFSFCVEPSAIILLLKKIPLQPIMVNFDDDKITIVAGKTKYDFPSHFDIKDFPNIASKTEGRKFLVPTEGFMYAINKCINTVGSDDLRPVMNGISIRETENIVYAASTDAHFLSMVDIDSGDSIKDVDFIIPKNAIPHIKAMTFGDNVEIELTGKSIIISNENEILTSRLIEGVYPKYNAILPTDWTTEVIYEASNLKNAIDRLSIIGAVAVIVEIDLSTGETKLTADNVDLSKSGEEYVTAISITNKSEEETLRIGMNVNKFLALSKNFDFSEMSVRFNSPSNPIIFKPANVNTDIELFLLMPCMV